jgi:predicted HicB family RNase H-like nuclease
LGFYLSPNSDLAVGDDDKAACPGFNFFFFENLLKTSREGITVGKSMITFEGKSVEELKQAFEDSVKDYLEFCTSRGEEPEKPFSGKFVVRLSPEIHRKVFLKAKLSDNSLNSWVSEVLEKAVESQ